MSTRELFTKRVAEEGGARLVAEKLGCTTAYVYLLQSEKSDKVPSIEMGAKIENLLGIPVKSWVEPAPDGKAA